MAVYTRITFKVYASITPENSPVMQNFANCFSHRVLTDNMSRNEAEFTGEWINNTRNFHF
jgi:hypothetical protein